MVNFGKAPHDGNSIQDLWYALSEAGFTDVDGENPEIDVITTPSQEFQIDEENSTQTPLAANAEFVGEWQPWGQNVAIAIAVVADEVGGANSDGLNAVKVDLSGDGGQSVGKTIEIDYPPADETGVGIQPIVTREATDYRVRYQNGDTDQNVFRLNTVELPKPVQEELRPIADSVTDTTIANTVKSVIAARDPDGSYVNIDANRFGDLNTNIDSVGNNAYRHAPRGDVSLYGEQKVGSKVPQIEIQWWEEQDPDVTLDTTKTGSADGITNEVEGYATFQSGTDTTASYIGETFKDIDYLTSSEIKASFSAAWIQPPTSEGDYSMLGLSDGENGFEIGYKGTTFGIRRLRDGNEVDFVPQPEFNGDKLDGNPESEYQRQNEPVPINHQAYDMWRIRYGWYGVAPTHIEVLAPDGHWVFVHKFDFTEETLPQTDKPDLPLRTFIEKENSDSTNIEQRVSAFFGGIVANVQLSQQPDGDYVSQKATGQSFIENELLTANEEFVSDWYDTDGWGSIGISVNSDQPSVEDGLIVEFSNDVQAANPTVNSSSSFTFTEEDTNGQQNLYLIIPTQLDGYRIRYQNGAIGQNEFNLVSTLFRDTRPRQTNLNTPISPDSVASTNRAIVFAENDNGDVEKVNKAEAGPSGGLRTAITKHETDTPIRPDNEFRTSQVSVPDEDGGGPIRILNGGLAGRTQFRVSNDGNEPVYLGHDSSLTTENGYQIDVGDEKTFPIGEATDIWMIGADVTGGSTTTTLDATTAETDGTATNPDNVVISDDTRAIFDEFNEFVTASGYDASAAQTRDEISDVMIGFEGQKDAGGDQTITYEETESNWTTGGTSITTTGTLTADNDSLYVASVMTRGADVDSVVGLGLDWSEAAVSTGADAKTEIWISEGSPTSTEQVTANFASTTTRSGIVVSRLNGVDLANPVVNASSNTGSTTNWSVSPTPNNAGDVIVGAVSRGTAATNDPEADDTERYENSSSSGATENRGAFAVQTRTVSGSDEPTDGIWSTAGDWAAVGIALEQEPLQDPEYLLEYEVGSEGVGPTTLSGAVSSTTDVVTDTDITGDRNWSYTDIDTIAVTLTDTGTGTAALEVDHIFVEFTEVDTGATQRVSLYEGGRQ